jgi:pimeloyl-ACP methyl ester carboxylesterase
MDQSRITDLTGVGGRQIAGVRWQPGKHASDRLAVCLPGLSYPSEGPLTFYMKLAFVAAGWDWWSIDYRYLEDDAFTRLDWPQRNRYLREEAVAIGEYVKRTANHRQIVLVGKSLGTIMVDTLMHAETFRTGGPRMGYVILTPTDVQGSVLDSLAESGEPALLVIGNRDRFFDPDLERRAAAMQNVRQLVIPGAGHVLEQVPDGTSDEAAPTGSLAASIRNLVPAVELIEKALTDRFFDQEGA